MSRLFGYEVKKIVMSRSTIGAFFVLFAIQVLLAFAANLGSTYVDDVFVETHMERNRIDRENGLALSGRVIDNVLLAEMRDAYGKIDEDDTQYLLTDVWKNEVRKYSDLYNKFRWWGLGNISLEDMSEFELYQLREEMRDEAWDYFELTESEKKYWQTKDEKLTLPFTYEYAAAWEELVDMHGGYMICLLFSFFLAISMVDVFAGEHGRRTDQLLLCSKYGRGKLYGIKLAAGVSVALLGNLMFLLVAMIGNFICYGTEGFGATLQISTFLWYSYPLSIGEAFLIMVGVLFLSSALTAVFTMVLADVIKSRIGAMAIVIGMTFAARLVAIPMSWRVLSQLWNYIPINLLKVDQGFLDLRLVFVFGISLTSWQFAPILYVVLLVCIVLIGSRYYKNYQVSGR